MRFVSKISGKTWCFMHYFNERMELKSHRATTTINSGIFVVFPLPVLFAALFEVQVKSLLHSFIICLPTLTNAKVAILAGWWGVVS